MGDRITWTTRSIIHGMGVVSTSSHAPPRYGHSVRSHHLGVRGCTNHNVSSGSRYLGRRPSFPLRRDTVLSPAADRARSVERARGQGSSMGYGHSVRALQFEKLYRVCVLAGVGWLL